MYIPGFFNRIVRSGGHICNLANNSPPKIPETSLHRRWLPLTGTPPSHHVHGVISLLHGLTVYDRSNNLSGPNPFRLVICRHRTDGLQGPCIGDNSTRAVLDVHLRCQAQLPFLFQDACQSDPSDDDTLAGCGGRDGRGLGGGLRVCCDGVCLFR